MKVQLLTCCESAAVDVATNRLSIFNIFTDVNSQAFPNAINLMVVAIIARDDSETSEVAPFV